MGEGVIEGPYFDDLTVGDVFSAPGVTLSVGRAAVHQSILGGRLELSSDEHLSRQVTGAVSADPGFVWDTAIGQSTVVTRRVIANLFYRGLVFHRLPAIGDTLRTRTEVVGLRQNESKPTGLAALRITTLDQQNRLILDFWRCAMLPLSSPEIRTGAADDLTSIGAAVDLDSVVECTQAWNVDPLRSLSGPALKIGSRFDLTAGDVVSSAPELARSTLNMAHVHHDEFSQRAGRLVYGGHTIGLAFAQLTKTLPQVVTIAAWHGCDHTGPVREGDTLVSNIEVIDTRTIPNGLVAVDLRLLVRVKSEAGDRPVLDWRPVAVALPSN